MQFRIRPWRSIAIMALLAFLFSGTLMPAHAQGGEEAWVEVQRFGLGYPNYVVYSPDGQHIMVNTGERTWHYDGALANSEPLPKNLFMMTWSADGTQMLMREMASRDTLLLDAATYEEAGRYPANPIEDAPNTQLLTRSPNGAYLLARNTEENKFIVLDEATLDVVAELPGHEVALRNIEWSPDGRLLAATSGDYQADETLPRELFVWEVATGEVIAVLPVDMGKSGYNQIRWSPDGAYLAAVYGDYVHILNAETWELTRQMEVNNAAFFSVAWHPNSQQLATGGRNVRVWDVASGAQQSALDVTNRYVRSLSWSPDGEQLVLVSNNGSVQLWDMTTRQPLVVDMRFSAMLDGVAFAPDMQTVATGGWDGILRVWDATSGDLLSHGQTRQGEMQGLEYAPAGDTLAACGFQVTLWDTADWAHSVYETPEFYIHYASWAPDGSRLMATGSSQEGTPLRIIDADTLTTLVELRAGADSLSRSGRWSPGGSRIASLNYSRSTGYIWNMATNRVIATVDDENGFRSFTWSPDGMALAGNTSEQLIVWDMTTDPPAIIRSAEVAGSLAYWSPDGLRIALTGSNRVTILDAATLETLAVIQTPLSRYRNPIQWAPDSRHILIAAGTSGYAALYELESSALPSAPALPTCAAAATGNANLRGGPGTDYPIVGQITGGEAVTARYTNSAGDWYFVEREDGTRVWVADFLLNVTCEGGVTLPVIQ